MQSLRGGPAREFEEAQILGHFRVALLHVADVLRGPTTQAQGAKGWGPWGPLGLFRNCSEWKAILSERLSRMEGHPNAQWKLNGCSLVGGAKMVPLLLEPYSERTLTSTALLGGGAKVSFKPHCSRDWGPDCALSRTIRGFCGGGYILSPTVRGIGVRTAL